MLDFAITAVGRASGMWLDSEEANRRADVSTQAAAAAHFITLVQKLLHHPDWRARFIEILQQCVAAAPIAIGDSSNPGLLLCL